MSTLSLYLGFFLFVSCSSCLPQDSRPPSTTPYCEIQFIDAATGRGIPLVELTTVNHLRYVTDNMGRIAFNEPGLMNTEVFFLVRSHGYEIRKDGFGFRGAKIKPQPAKLVKIEMSRSNLAERLCRLTGEGRFRDSILLGREVPDTGKGNESVAGQDSVQAAVYRGKIHWFWGDTARLSYPLGLFRTAGATSTIPPLKADISYGLGFDYFVDRSGFCRAMMPLLARSEGVVWIDGVCTVRDQKGIEKLIAHYSRRKDLHEEVEHGIAIFDDGQSVFEVAKELSLKEKWRFPHGHPEVLEKDGKKWLLCGLPALNVRVPATLEAVLDPKSYEAFTCEQSGVNKQPTTIRLDATGKPLWLWQTDLPPMSSRDEADLVKLGKLKPDESHFYPMNQLDPSERVKLHNGTVRWNQHRQKWILIAGQIEGKSSNLGEIWLAEASLPTGPFTKAIKVVSHDRQSFYNVCHHAFLDRENGRFIHFEGTYTSDFSGNPDKTPRYEYNQILYRLDIDAALGEKKTRMK